MTRRRYTTSWRKQWDNRFYMRPRPPRSIPSVLPFFAPNNYATHFIPYVRTYVAQEHQPLQEKNIYTQEQRLLSLRNELENPIFLIILMSDFATACTFLNTLVMPKSTCDTWENRIARSFWEVKVLQSHFLHVWNTQKKHANNSSRVSSDT